MSRRTFAACCCLLIGSVGSVAVSSQTRGSSSSTLYEGARLITGDGSPPVENGAFVVQDGRLTAVGRKGAIRAPAGATRVDMTGKTVMPVMNNVHVHIGYEGYSSWSARNNTPQNILDHLQREAFFGVGAVMTMGDQPSDRAIRFQADQAAGKFPPAAQFFFAAGMAPPGGGPDSLLITGTTPLHAVYEVKTPEEARAAVRKIADLKIPQIKFWVDNRDTQRGIFQKLPPEVYGAIIDEAHKRGIITHAHATSLPDQKGVVKAGVDVLVHILTGEKIDDEFVAILKEKKPYWTPVMGLSDRPEVCEENNQFVEQVLPAKTIADIREGRNAFGLPGCAAPPNANTARRDENLKYNFPKMIESGARLVLGTDAGVLPQYTFGSAEHHEIEMYVKLGLTPAQAIVAATGRPTEVLGNKATGMLAVGKNADFVVLNANPLDNIRNTRQIAGVYLRGAMLDRGALLAKWRKPMSEQK
jgi:imidazolonepropionase-like amidohydrolase